ncbi:MAG: hypothetical protein MUC92_04050 [Fimbriimonadaceae bacterium]|nr:hypothetical protein [Fimbriimonadaceae bacterium]
MQFQLVQGAIERRSEKTVADSSCEAEAWFLNQPGVEGAEVWESRGSLLAKVYVSEHAWLSANDLKQACHLALGDESTPKMILLERSRRKAA